MYVKFSKMAWHRRRRSFAAQPPRSPSRPRRVAAQLLGDRLRLALRSPPTPIPTLSSSVASARRAPSRIVWKAPAISTWSICANTRRRCCDRRPEPLRPSQAQRERRARAVKAACRAAFGAGLRPASTALRAARRNAVRSGRRDGRRRRTKGIPAPTMTLLQNLTPATHLQSGIALLSSQFLAEPF